MGGFGEWPLVLPKNTTAEAFDRTRLLIDLDESTDAESEPALLLIVGVPRDAGGAATDPAVKLFMARLEGDAGQPRRQRRLGLPDPLERGLRTRGRLGLGAAGHPRRSPHGALDVSSARSARQSSGSSRCPRRRSTRSTRSRSPTSEWRGTPSSTPTRSIPRARRDGQHSSARAGPRASGPSAHEPRLAPRPHSSAAARLRPSDRRGDAPLG